MRKESDYPPMIIIIEILLILIIILLVNYKDQTTVNIPPNHIFQGAILVQDKDGFQNVVNQFTKQIEKPFIPSSNIGFTYYQKCTTQCKGYENNDYLYIYFPEELFNQIAKIKFIASHTNYNCKDLTFDITHDGEINFQELIKNECLKNIEGIEYLMTDRG